MAQMQVVEQHRDDACARNERPRHIRRRLPSYPATLACTRFIVLARFMKMSLLFTAVSADDNGVMRMTLMVRRASRTGRCTSQDLRIYYACGIGARGGGLFDRSWLRVVVCVYKPAET